MRARKVEQDAKKRTSRFLNYDNYVTLRSRDGRISPIARMSAKVRYIVRRSGYFISQFISSSYITLSRIIPAYNFHHVEMALRERYNDKIFLCTERRNGQTLCAKVAILYFNIIRERERESASAQCVYVRVKPF